VPPLPETSDPFQLLGVPPQAGEDALRAAYERLVSRYPPDTAPDEFARIHAAFGRALGIEPPPWRPPPLPALDGDGLYERLVGLLDEGRYDDLAREVAGLELTDSPTAAVFLRATAVVVWRSPLAIERVRALAPRIRALGQQALAEAAETEAELAIRFHRIAIVHPSSAVIALFGDHLLASPARRRAVTAAVGELLARGSTLLDICDRIDTHDRPLARALRLRLQRESPLWNDRALAPLPADLRAALVARRRDIRDPPRLGRSKVGAADAVATVSL
jgi:hypothetical protein